MNECTAIVVYLSLLYCSWCAGIIIGELASLDLLYGRGPYSYVKSQLATPRGPSPELVKWCESEEGQRTSQAIAKVIRDVGVSSNDLVKTIQYINRW